MNTLQINKISKLHNGKDIFFCKTDFIEEAFIKIQNTKNDVIFISGNSDYCIDNSLVKKAPKNIKKWFCQNRLSDDGLLESIPIGIENAVPCSIDGHGYVWPHAIEKPSIINRLKNEAIQNCINLIYSNFNVNTNPAHRNEIKQYISKLDHITKEECTLNYEDFVKGILSHEAVLCPQGNGEGDNHRIYETLHLGKVPITFNNKQFKYLHHKFPVVLIENIKELSDKYLIENKIREAQSKFDDKYLDANYWIDKIKNEAQKRNTTR
tara:strand:- start:56040 stop:56837 length:798 start_codon:yes stop_codon:yes gene_type:complete